MRRYPGHLIAPMLAAVLIAGSVGLVIGVPRERASAPAISTDEQPADAAGLEREPASASALSEGRPAAAASADPRLDIKCRIYLPSCRRWIALRAQKNGRLVHSAERQ